MPDMSCKSNFHAKCIHLEVDTTSYDIYMHHVALGLAFSRGCDFVMQESWVICCSVGCGSDARISVRLNSESNLFSALLSKPKQNSEFSSRFFRFACLHFSLWMIDKQHISQINTANCIIITMPINTLAQQHFSISHCSYSAQLCFLLYYFSCWHEKDTQSKLIRMS